MNPEINAAGPFVATLDIGSSSIRALLFDGEARRVEGYGARLAYRIHTTAEGSAEVDAEELAQLTIDCLDELHRQVHADGIAIAAIAGSAFWHSFLGIDEGGRPTAPILHLLDTRSVADVPRVPDTRARTGCVPHSSYWPAKLLWLERNRPVEFASTRQWLSFPEYIFLKLFGNARASTSMVSGSGLWDQNAGDYDQETLAALPVRREQLAEPSSLDEPESELLPEYRALWPAFAGARWYPFLGDGACSNLGTGCVTADRAALVIGTTGALRVSFEAPRAELAPGLFCYRVDRRRFVTGGAISNGGNVFAWMRRTLALPKDIEARLEAAVPGSHKLTMLPFFAGERTPYWRADLRAAIVGMNLATEPFDILRAGLESVALRFREIYCLLAARQGAPPEVVASGGALISSPGWTQMMADALGRPVTVCTEPEASARGAAVWALRQSRAIESPEAVAPSLGASFLPRPEHQAAFERLLEEQRELYARLFGSRA